MNEQNTRDARLTPDDLTFARVLLEAASALPRNNRDYILGYAEGIIAMSGRDAPRQLPA